MRFIPTAMLGYPRRIPSSTVASLYDITPDNCLAFTDYWDKPPEQLPRLQLYAGTPESRKNAATHIAMTPCSPTPGGICFFYLVFVQLDPQIR